MPSATELASYIGRVGMIDRLGLGFKVTVLDARQSYGNVQYLVTPVAGSGKNWVANISWPADL